MGDVTAAAPLWLRVSVETKQVNSRSPSGSPFVTGHSRIAYSGGDAKNNFVRCRITLPKAAGLCYDRSVTILGKIIGGAAGFAFGGPLGVLLGAGLGHVMDSRLLSTESNDEAARKITFTIGVIALSAKMAKSDNQVTEDEIKAFEKIFKIPPHEARNVGSVFDLARQDTTGYESYAKQIAEIFEGYPHVLEDLLGALFHIAMIDGVIYQPEEEYLANVAQIFGFSDELFESIRILHLDPYEACPYTILRIDDEASDDMLKAQYRKLTEENHPDLLMAQGMPREFIEVANLRLAAFKNAYERIEEQRGMTA